MHAAWSKAYQEIDILPQFRFSLEAEIIFERHAVFGEDQEGDTHSDRCRGHCRNTQLAATGEGLAPDVDGEKIEAVDEQVRALQEGVDILHRHAVRKFHDFGFWIYVLRHS